MSVRALASLLAFTLVPFMSVDAHHQDDDSAPAQPYEGHPFAHQPHFLVHWSDVMEQGGSVVIETGTDEDGRCLAIGGRTSFSVNESGERAMGFERVPDQPCTYRVQASEVKDPGPRAEWRTQPSTP